MCISREFSPSQRRGEFVELDFIGVQLGRIDPRVTEEGLRRSDVAAALAQESICEAVPKLVR